jgi:hypothetical protein
VIAVAKPARRRWYTSPQAPARIVCHVTVRPEQTPATPQAAADRDRAWLGLIELLTRSPA